MRPDTPNVLYIHSHDTGRYTQPYGHAVGTPAIQRLAEEGVLFRQAFCAAPTCSASRASLLTGMWSHTNGMLGLQHRGFGLNDPSKTLPRMLRDAGYETAIGGINHVAEDAREIGYSRTLECASSRADDLAPVAARFLAEARPQPFFLSVGFFETHRDFPDPGPEDDPRYALPPAALPDTPDTRRDMAAFKTSARLMDRGVGEVLGALERAGLAGNTLVIYTTDHGLPFPGMKCNLTDHGIGVSLVARGPDGFSGGRVVDSMLSQVDLFPTLCDYLGLEPPGWLQGRSFMPVVRGETERAREEVFAEVNYHAAYEPQRCARTDRWKYIRRFDDREKPVLPNCDDGPSKSLWMARGWTSRPRAREMLFDLTFDPNESDNLAGDPRFEDTLGEMRERLERWMRDTDDPILNVPIPLPEGAVATDPDGVSP